MAFLDIESQGLDDMAAAIKKLEKLGSIIQGIEFLGDQRDATNNAEIIAYHRDGIESDKGTIVRDITASDAEIQEAVNIFMDEVSDFLDDDSTSPEDKAVIEREARKIVAKSLKKAAEPIRKGMKKRVQDGKDKDGNNLTKVTPETAEQRLKEYGVPTTEVMKASGDLLSNLSRKAYRFTKKK